MRKRVVTYSLDFSLLQSSRTEDLLCSDLAVRLRNVFCDTLTVFILNLLSLASAIFFSLFSMCSDHRVRRYDPWCLHHWQGPRRHFVLPQLQLEYFWFINQRDVISCLMLSRERAPGQDCLSLPQEISIFSFFPCQESGFHRDLNIANGAQTMSLHLVYSRCPVPQAFAPVCQLLR